MSQEPRVIFHKNPPMPESPELVAARERKRRTCEALGEAVLAASVEHKSAPPREWDEAQAATRALSALLAQEADWEAVEALHGALYPHDELRASVMCSDVCKLALRNLRASGWDVVRRP